MAQFSGGTSGPSHANDEVKAIKAQLLHDLRTVIDQKPPTTGILDSLRNNIASNKIYSFLSGAALWIFLLLLALPKSFKRSAPYIARLAIFALFALVSGWVATILNLKLSTIATALVSFLVPLVLLAIVGLILGIAIPQFAAYRIRGYNAKANSILRNSRTLLESYFANNGIYPHTLVEAGIHSIQQQVNLEFRLSNQDKYILSATHDKGDKVYFVYSETNEIISKDKKANPTA